MNKFILDNNAEIYFEHEVNTPNLFDSIEFRLGVDDFNGEKGNFIIQKPSKVFLLDGKNENTEINLIFNKKIKSKNNLIFY